MYCKFCFLSHEHLSSTHRSGWLYVDSYLRQFHNPYGIDFLMWGDKFFKDPIILKRKWAGFIHNVVSYPDEYPAKYSNKIHPLNELVKKQWFIESCLNCVCLFVFCEYAANYLRKYLTCPIVVVTHPSIDYEKHFDYNSFLKCKNVCHIGQWMRKYHSFLELNTQLKKIFVKVNGFEKDYEEMLRYTTANTNDICYLSRLSNSEYDNLLTSSVVFLDLYDVCACNTVIECIMTNTPILLKHLPANIEYLGNDYPFFFRDIEEANCKVNNLELIEKTHVYLKNKNKEIFNIDNLVESIFENCKQVKSFKM